MTGPDKAMIGSNYNLTCFVITYTNNPVITWTKDKQEITPTYISNSESLVRISSVNFIKTIVFL